VLLVIKRKRFKCNKEINMRNAVLLCAVIWSSGFTGDYLAPPIPIQASEKADAIDRWLDRLDMKTEAKYPFETKGYTGSICSEYFKDTLVLHINSVLGKERIQPTSNELDKNDIQKYLESWWTSIAYPTIVHSHYSKVVFWSPIRDIKSFKCKIELFGTEEIRYSYLIFQFEVAGGYIVDKSCKISEARI
jgi:hypothetical protein